VGYPALLCWSVRTLRRARHVNPAIFKSTFISIASGCSCLEQFEIKPAKHLPQLCDGCIGCRFPDLKPGELRLTHECEDKKYQEREAQRRAREEQREEERAQHEIEKARQGAEKDELDIRSCCRRLVKKQPSQLEPSCRS